MDVHNVAVAVALHVNDVARAGRVDWRGADRAAAAEARDGGAQRGTKGVSESGEHNQTKNKTRPQRDTAQAYQCDKGFLNRGHDKPEGQRGNCRPSS